MYIIMAGMSNQDNIFGQVYLDVFRRAVRFSLGHPLETQDLRRTPDVLDGV
jgi:hypothetical protein